MGAIPAVHIDCPCGNVLRLREWHAGKEAFCASCGRVLQVPLAPAPAADSTQVWKEQQARPRTFFVDDQLHFACACGKRLKLPKDKGGVTGKCPECGGPVRAPVAWQCPCGEKYALPAELAGRKVRCLACGTKAVLEAPGAKAV